MNPRWSSADLDARSLACTTGGIVVGARSLVDDRTSTEQVIAIIARVRRRPERFALRLALGILAWVAGRSGSQSAEAVELRRRAEHLATQHQNAPLERVAVFGSPLI